MPPGRAMMRTTAFVGSSLFRKRSRPPISALTSIIMESVFSPSKGNSKRLNSPLPLNCEPYPVVANIAFAEGPIFDGAGNLYFVNYVRKGTLGKMTPDGTVSVFCETGGQVNGLKIDSMGYIIGADQGGKRVEYDRLWVARWLN